MDYTTPMHELQIDLEACGDALPCLKCVHACINQGHNCIMFYNTETPVVTEDWPKKLSDIPHMIKTHAMWECDGCLACVEACPKKALSFVPAKVHLPRAVVQQPPAKINCTVLKDGTVVTEDYVEELIYPQGD